MKKEFTIPVTVSAYTKEEAESKVELLLQMGAFFKDFNVENLAGSLVQHFVLAKVNQLTQRKVDLSSCINSFGAYKNTHRQKPGQKATNTEKD